MSLPEVFLDCFLLPELLGADPTREDSPIVPQSFSKVNLLVMAGPRVERELRGILAFERTEGALALAPTQ